MTSRVDDLDRPSSDSEISDHHMERPREVRPWSADEVALLRIGLTSRDIARSIGRTTGAVNAKRFRLTHSVRDRSHEHIDGDRSRRVWTDDDDRLVMDAELDIEELSRILGRSMGCDLSAVSSSSLW